MIVYDRLEIEKRARRIRAAEFARMTGLLAGWLRRGCARLMQLGRSRRAHAAPRRR